MGVDGSIYEWYKDNELVSTIESNDELTLHNLQPTDAGVYHCQIKSLLYATELTLISRRITINVKDCTISLVAGEQICNEQNNTFSQAIQVTYSDAPTEGVLLVNDIQFPITGSPQTVSLTNLTPNSTPTSVIAFFSALPSCSTTANDLFTAPATCISNCEETDMEISNPIQSKTYQAKETINATATIEKEHTTIFKAGQSITLATGFHAVAGSNFTAQIALCEDAATLTSPTAQARTTTTNVPTIVEQSLIVRPNPFRNHTTIDYTLTEAQTVSLAVYSATGQLVKTFTTNALQNSGAYSYDFDASPLKGGMYIVVLQTGTATTSKKIILIE